MGPPYSAGSNWPELVSGSEGCRCSRGRHVESGASPRALARLGCSRAVGQIPAGRPQVPGVTTQGGLTSFRGTCTPESAQRLPPAWPRLSTSPRGSLVATQAASCGLSLGATNMFFGHRRCRWRHCKEPSGGLYL